MLKFLLIVAFWYAVMVLIAALVSDRMIFLPPPASYDEKSLPVASVTTDDGRSIAVLHLPNPDALHTLLFSHGNAEDLGYLAPFLAQLRDSGFSVLAYDYGGYGLSSGRPSTTGAYRDEAAVFRHATQALRIPAGKIILHGRSVGSGPAVELATREKVGGLVIESGFVSTYRVMTRIPLLPFDKFPNLKRMPDVRCPVLVIHGREDEIIPFWHGEELFAAAPQPKTSAWLDGAGHNDIADVAWDEYVRVLKEFAAGLR